MAGRLVLMGSGELAPTMVSTHRRTLEAVGASEVVLLDTPFGFQENVEQLTDKLAPPAAEQPAIFTPLDQKIVDTLRSLDPDTLRPIEALSLLAELKKQLS